MGTRRQQSAARLTAGIRREIATDVNVRVLKALPAFKVDSKLPKKLKALLEQLDEREEPAPTRR
ncbi:hypothetical protein [Aminobacter sp. HY435]|uniref:hypothetical protein n=1 Tax=Aminobacter sp. HY435 TaxID=2970917 RepID=UPI0022B9814C|nr:hypothetical protein [Aminobacter sp. HY435]